MEDNAQKLNLKQDKAIMALLTEPTIRQAAEKAGVGETTLFRWLKEDDFDQAFKEAKKTALSHTIARLQQTTTNAVETLKSVMENEESPASSRVSAAKTVLEMAFKAYEIQDLAAEVDIIKQFIEESKARK